MLLHWGSIWCDAVSAGACVKAYTLQLHEVEEEEIFDTFRKTYYIENLHFEIFWAFKWNVAQQMAGAPKIPRQFTRCNTWPVLSPKVLNAWLAPMHLQCTRPLLAGAARSRPWVHQIRWCRWCIPPGWYNKTRAETADGTQCFEGSRHSDFWSCRGAWYAFKWFWCLDSSIPYSILNDLGSQKLTGFQNLYRRPCRTLAWPYLTTNRQGPLYLTTNRQGPLEAISLGAW